MRRSALLVLRFENRIILIGLLFSAMFWVVDSVIHSAIFQNGSVRDQLFSPSGFQIWCRSFVGFVLVLFSVYVKSLLAIRDRTQEKLRESEERYKDLYDNAPDMFASIDAATGRILECNNALLNSTGYSKEEIKALPYISKLYHPACEDVRKQVFDLFVETGSVHDVELQLMCKDGSTIDVNLNISAVRDEQGRVLRSRSVWRDITRRKQAEEALKQSHDELEQRVEERTAELSEANKTLGEKIEEHKLTEQALRLSEERFELAVQGSDVGIWDWDISSGRIYWSPRLYELNGYDPQEVELSIESVIDAIHEQDKQLVLDALRAHHELREPYSVEFRRRTKQGQYVWLRSSGKATWNNDGTPTRMVGTTEDISDRKQAEKVIQDKDLKLENLLSNVDAIILEGDPFDFYYVGGQVEKILGYPKKMWFDHPDAPLGFWASILHRDDIDKIEICRNAISRGENHSFEYRMIAADGRQIWFYDTVTVETENGKPVKTRCVMIDITQRKQAEQEREKLIEELEIRNAEMERFTYTVSHDLKSPLITIKGFLGMLEEDIEKENHAGVESDMSRISGAADRMVQLLDELLELSRVSRIVHPHQDVSLADLAANAVEMRDAQISEAEIQVDISPDLPVIHGDQVRLQEVLQNLIDNAVKFTRDRPQPRIEIGARQDDGEVICYVRDNGVGIDPRYHEKIFGLFEQLDPQKEGTGIGLAIVKRIIDVHGGRIWVESEGVGKGAMFCFTIPETIAEERCSVSM